MESSRFSELWEPCSATLGAYIASLVYDRHHAEDILQEVAKTAAESIHRYDAARSFSNWTLGIARKKVLKYYDDHSRDRLQFSSDLVDRISDVYEMIQTRQSDRSEALSECLDRLAGRVRRAVELKYRDGLSYDEMGRMLDMSKNAVAVMVHRSRIALRDCVRRRLGESASDETGLDRKLGS